jgi:hypothetical protein
LAAAIEQQMWSPVQSRESVQARFRVAPSPTSQRVPGLHDRAAFFGHAGSSPSVVHDHCGNEPWLQSIVRQVDSEGQPSHPQQISRPLWHAAVPHGTGVPA